MVWNDDVARKVISADGVTMLVTLPNLVRARGVVSIFSLEILPFI